MITESKVAEIFCIADDFRKEFDAEMAKNTIGPASGAGKRRRKRMMPDAEVITILICFHFNSYRNFKHYYLCGMCGRNRAVIDTLKETRCSASCMPTRGIFRSRSSAGYGMTGSTS